MILLPVQGLYNTKYIIGVRLMFWYQQLRIGTFTIRKPGPFFYTSVGLLRVLLEDDFIEVIVKITYPGSTYGLQYIVVLQNIARKVTSCKPEREGVCMPTDLRIIDQGPGRPNLHQNDNHTPAQSQVEMMHANCLPWSMTRDPNQITVSNGNR